LRFENDTLWVDAFVSRVVLVNDHHFNVANDYDWFSGVYASTRTLVPKQETQLYLLARNTDAKSPTATTGRPQAGGPPARDIYTLGLRVKSLPGEFAGWDYDAELAGQFGNFYDPGLASRLGHEAFAAHIAGGYTCPHASWSPRLGLEYNYASGDSNPADGTHETFENLFPTNHKFYGYMDFASWQNLHNVRLTASAKPVKGLTVTLDYHLFWLADTADFFYAVSGVARSTGGYGRNPANDSFAGSELDCVASYVIKPWATAQAGYGHFFRGGYVKDSLAASQDADWFYLQAIINF
jgi:Alginate export